MLKRSEGAQISFGDMGVVTEVGREHSLNSDEILSALALIESRVVSVRDDAFRYTGRAFRDVEVHIGDFDDAPGRAELGFESPVRWDRGLEWMPSKLYLSRSLRREALWWTLIHYGAHLAQGYAMQSCLNGMDCDSSYPGMTVDKFLERFKKRVRSSATWRKRHCRHGDLWRAICRSAYGRRVSESELVCPPDGWAYESPVHAEGHLVSYTKRDKVVDMSAWRAFS